MPQLIVTDTLICGHAAVDVLHHVLAYVFLMVECFLSDLYLCK